MEKFFEYTQDREFIRETDPSLIDLTQEWIYLFIGEYARIKTRMVLLGYYATTFLESIILILS